MDKIESFGQADSCVLNDAALANCEIRNLWEVAGPTLRKELVASLSDFGISSDRDAILLGVVVAPINKLLQCGWNESEILSLSEKDKEMAANYSFSASDLQNAKSVIDFNEPEHKIRAALHEIKYIGSGDLLTDLKRLAAYRKQYPIVKELSIKQAITFCNRVKLNAPSWYKNAINACSLQEVQYATNANALNEWAEFLVMAELGPIKDQLIGDFRAISYRKDLTDVLWLHFIDNGMYATFPIYCVQDIREFIALVSDSIQFYYVQSGSNLYISDERSLRTLHRKYPEYLQDIDDPVLSFVKKIANVLHFSVDDFDELQQHSTVFWLIELFRKIDKDWIIALLFPKYFDYPIEHAVDMSLEDTILDKYDRSRVLRTESSDLSVSMVQIENAMMPIYVAYASGMLDKIIDEGGVIKVVTTNKDSRNINTCVRSFTEWLRNREK